MYSNGFDVIKTFNLHMPRVTSSQRLDAVVIPGIPGTQIIIRYVVATGGNAGDVLNILPASSKGKTTSATTGAISETTHELTSDGTADQLSGIAVAASDFALIKLAARHETLGAWQLITIGSVGAGNANHIDIDTMTARNGITGLRAAATAGDPAYVIWAEDVGTVDVGNATVTKEWVGAGHPGYPVAVQLNHNTAAVTAQLQGVAWYVRA